MRTSHALLLRLYHDPQYQFDDVTVSYINRGAPGDLSRVRGTEIRHLDPDYMELASPVGTTPVPYHRICEIRYQEKVLWKRSPPVHE